MRIMENVITNVFFLTIFTLCNAEIDSQLLEAIKNDDAPKITQLLTEHTGWCNAQGEDDFTPLHYATESQKISSVQALLQKNANVNAQNTDGDTPMHLALQGMKKKSEIIKLLRDHKADLYIPNKKGIQPIHYAAGFGYFDINDWKDCIKKKPDALLALDNDGNSLIHYAARYGSFETITNLLQVEKRLSLDTKNKKKETPLHCATQLAKFDSPAYPKLCKTAQLLIDNKAAINAIDSKGFTPLHYASQNAAREIVKMLLDYGAHMLATAEVQGKKITPLQCAHKAKAQLGPTMYKILSNMSEITHHTGEYKKREQELEQEKLKKEQIYDEVITLLQKAESGDGLKPLIQALEKLKEKLNALRVLLLF